MLGRTYDHEVSHLQWATLSLTFPIRAGLLMYDGMGDIVETK